MMSVWKCLIAAAVCVVLSLVCGKPAPHHRIRRWEEFPNVTFTFECADKAVGFYADMEYKCMIFHMCDEDGRRIPHMCGGNNTGFNQQFRICDWMDNFECSESPDWYYLNELTYRTDPPKLAESS